MKRFWPGFVLVTKGPEHYQWVGEIRPIAVTYRVLVDWSLGEAPNVSMLSPKLKPRAGEHFIDIPHLNLNVDRPERSAFCLFDPNNNEWDTSKFIADTTVPWAAEWLWRYEQWHLLGAWIGSGVGPETFREVLQAEKLKKVESDGR
ncbi:MAG: hypothetical protein KIS81_08730 [Maricaulaceae bacterium]|nr:hypothetical protein [Maricaulaceae bacterium]